jgi:transcriptional regulator with XRE-family HTH domain
MNKKSSYRDLIDGAETAPDFWVSVTSTEFLADVHRKMAELGVNKTELARRLNTSKAYVSRILAGNVNFTLLTMIKLAMALRGIVHTHVADKEALTIWRDLYVNTQPIIKTQAAESNGTDNAGAAAGDTVQVVAVAGG